MSMKYVYGRNVDDWYQEAERLREGIRALMRVKRMSDPGLIHDLRALLDEDHATDRDDR